MCFLICRVGERPLLAANRDEVYARPFSPPRRWVAETPFWAPRDEADGGTWIGVNARGLVAAITNRSLLQAEAGRESRGHLVTGVLAHGALNDARAWLERQTHARSFNPFQLYVTQGARAFLGISGPEGFRLHDLEAGWHYVSNLHERGAVALDLRDDAGWETIRPHLADRSPRLPGGYPICKDKGTRGTVASALIEPGRRFLFADGPPDRVPYETVASYGP